MKVKVGDTIYDSERTPIMVIFSDKEMEHVKNMSPTDRRYAVFPKLFGTTNDRKKWMRTEAIGD